MALELNVNGRDYSVEADSETSLLTVLREHLGLTGSKFGCGEGECGACTVLIDGYSRRACITQAGHAQGKKVRTIEDLDRGGRLHPVQQAFVEADAFQCAYCTAGMIMTTVALLESNPRPTDAQIAEFLQGNICRCGTYPRILDAVCLAAEALAKGGAQ